MSQLSREQQRIQEALQNQLYATNMTGLNRKNLTSAEIEAARKFAESQSDGYSSVNGLEYFLTHGVWPTK